MEFKRNFPCFSEFLLLWKSLLPVLFTVSALFNTTCSFPVSSRRVPLPGPRLKNYEVKLYVSVSSILFTRSITMIIKQTLTSVYHLQPQVVNWALSRVKRVGWSVKWTVKGSGWELLIPASNQTCPPWWVQERWKAVERGKKGTVQSPPPGAVPGKLMDRPAVMDKIGFCLPRLSLPHNVLPRLHPRARLLRNSNWNEEVRSTGFLIKIKVRRLLKLILNSELTTKLHT